ncbi:MAG TPA: hydroxysqualene dehydroxylase HpnE [Burkholderiaceae bacterium]|nr:hydroxysqualene dehydroxylase HpnE [Burkholderiaceae bacterium]
MKVAIIGAGWAGMAAAVQITRAGHGVTVLEASRILGGRARGMEATLPGGIVATLDNGQHIMIGAYTETLALMRLVGVDPDQALLRLPLTLQFPDGQGLRLSDGQSRWGALWPPSLDVVAGILTARGWTWRDKAALIRGALGWQAARFECSPQTSVADLCRALTPRVFAELIEPLCISALNTPPEQSSGQVFLRVLRDALFGVRGGSHLLLPRTDLSALFPAAAARWLLQRGGSVLMGHRVATLGADPANAGRWLVDGQAFDQVVLACPSWEAARLVEASGAAANAWLHQAKALAFEAITTVYASSSARLAQPMLSLRSSAQAPAQFVFDRGQLGGPGGLLAFVVSASHGERDTLQQRVLAQGRAQLGVADLEAVQTVVEKRATFACTPGLQRPSQQIAPGLWACGDYVQGPYPATLEGAVRSAITVAGRI